MTPISLTKLAARRLPAKIKRQAGMSYVELLLASVIIAISVVPISEALQSSMLVARSDIEASSNHYRLVAKFEEVLAESFPSLASAALGPTTASSFSDPVATPKRRLVYISLYDVDNADGDDDAFTGTETDMLWIAVEQQGGNRSLASLKSQL